jgi:hypothetical protein
VKFMRTITTLIAGSLTAIAWADTILVEAEQFSQRGGWMLDTQFIETMGSPYLNAHGMGKPVAAAETSVAIKAAGEYQVWVRTIDWSERLGRAEGAGSFTLAINGAALKKSMGMGAPKWSWESAGSVKLEAGSAKLALQDLSGFNARVDAIFLSSEAGAKPPEACMMVDRLKWDFVGAAGPVTDAGEFDLVVVGGGYGGMGAAISAARLGAKVALIQNREVLGGNGSSEVRVWAMGDTPPSEYGLADIVKEI